jgi:hypothetical protein
LVATVFWPAWCAVAVRSVAAAVPDNVLPRDATSAPATIRARELRRDFGRTFMTLLELAGPA